MKKSCKILLLSALLCMLTACGRTHNAPGGTDPVDDGAKTEKLTQKIVFVYQYTNWAWIYTNKGYYIDGEGNRVAYDVSDEDQKYADIGELTVLLESREDSGKEPYLSEEELEEYVEWIKKIASDYELESRCSGSADMGSFCYYGIRYDSDGKAEAVLLLKEGDWITVNKDPYAMKLASELRKK